MPYVVFTTSVPNALIGGSVSQPSGTVWLISPPSGNEFDTPALEDVGKRTVSHQRAWILTGTLPNLRSLL